MKSPIRTTIVYGILSAIAAMPLAGVLVAPLGWPVAFKLVLWAILAGYALLLAHWCQRRPIVLLFPLVLLLGAALWPGVYAGFFFMAMGVLAWIRSGICFDRTPFRAVVAEILTLAGGAGLMAILTPAGTLAWTLSIWLFALIQSLYFFIVPLPARLRRQTTETDPFTAACREARRILEG